jgi:hypothetical protein
MKPPPLSMFSLAVTTVCAVAFALVARHWLIEPASMGVFCELAKEGGQCQLRAVLIWLLNNQRLGWLALALSAATFLIRIPALSVAALFVAGVGLVLYNVELSGPAWLIAGMAITSQHKAKVSD